MQNVHQWLQRATSLTLAYSLRYPSAAYECPACRLQGRCAFTLATHQPDSENVLMLINTTRPYAWGRLGQAPAPGSTFVWDRGLNKSVQCTPAICPFATPISGSNGTQYVNRAPVHSGNGNSIQDVRTNKLTTVGLQASDFATQPKPLDHGHA